MERKGEDSGHSEWKESAESLLRRPSKTSSSSYPQRSLLERVKEAPRFFFSGVPFAPLVATGHVLCSDGKFLLSSVLFHINKSAMNIMLYRCEILCFGKVF